MKLKKLSDSIEVVKEIKELDKVIDDYVQDRVVKLQLKSASNRIKDAVKIDVIEVTGAMVDFTFKNVNLMDEEERFYRKLEQISITDLATICDIGRTTAYRYKKSRSIPEKFTILLKKEIDKRNL